jgi:hypothetical protein
MPSSAARPSTWCRPRSATPLTFNTARTQCEPTSRDNPWRGARSPQPRLDRRILLPVLIARVRELKRGRMLSTKQRTRPLTPADSGMRAPNACCRALASTQPCTSQTQLLPSPAGLPRALGRLSSGFGSWRRGLRGNRRGGGRGLPCVLDGRPQRDRDRCSTAYGEKPP